MSDFVTVQTFLNSMEAELAKNLLESNGVKAMLTNDNVGGMRPDLSHLKGIKLVVEQQDEARALELLSEETEENLSADEQRLVDEQAEESKRADEEFEQMRVNELKAKAQGIKQNAIWGVVFLIGALVCFLMLADKPFGFRGGLACLFLVVVQLFVCWDGKQAQAELKKRGEG